MMSSMTVYFYLLAEDGTVTPDQDTVETFLQRNRPTNVQIMKFKTEKQGIDITVDNVTYMPDAISEAPAAVKIAVTNSTGVITNEASTPVIATSSSVGMTAGVPSSTVTTVPALVAETTSVTTPVTSKTRAKIIKTESKAVPRPERTKPTKPKPKIVKEVVEEESDEDFNDEDFDFDIDDDENDSDFDFEEELKAEQTPKRVKIKESKESKEVKQEIPKVDTNVEKVQRKLWRRPPDQKPEQPEAKPPEKKPPKKKRKVGGKEPTTPITPEASSPTKPGKITKAVWIVKLLKKLKKKNTQTTNILTIKVREDELVWEIRKSKRKSIEEKPNKTDLSRLDKHSQELKKSEKPAVKYPETVESSEGGEEIPGAEDIRSIIDERGYKVVYN
ncbi:hypothetical protein NQ314_007198 [Rhamnusium bicolor]|uniref:Uncharacterized protein n=1 Tax=Rhamnusium bicolor TaxID=1586634 RepID=A0AAV8YR74_9CUCU|nr:hypothetical protein NQ314_007198 [Rhamnusium bicolor]